MKTLFGFIFLMSIGASVVRAEDVVSAEKNEAREFERKPASVDRPKETEMKQADIEKIRELRKVVQKILVTDKF